MDTNYVKPTKEISRIFFCGFWFFFKINKYFYSIDSQLLVLHTVAELEWQLRIFDAYTSRYIEFTSPIEQQRFVE
jgi:hypothetical protein